MADIDNRIVELSFDDSNFNDGADRAMTTLSKLKKESSLDGAPEAANKNLSNLSKMFKAFDVGPVTSAVESIADRFTTMGLIGMSVLDNLVNRAVNTGLQLASALTFQPMTQGFQEYQMQIDSIQTMLANTKQYGTTVSQINAGLDELNEYADLTIYNFAQMTKNASLFTTAGLKFEDTLTIVKGLANTAAMFGANNAAATRAMYQLSQAYQVGTVRLMDWRSMENAGIGGKVFQDLIIEVARTYGKNVDEMIKKHGSFRDSLSEGWLDTEKTMTTALAIMAGDLKESDLLAMGFTKEQIPKLIELGQTALDAAGKVRTFGKLWETITESIGSGWAIIARTIIGDFDEATELLTGIKDEITGIIDATVGKIEEVAKVWHDLGGRDDVISGFANMWGYLKDTFGEISERYREMFPAITGERLKEITERFKEFTENIAPRTDEINRVAYIFQGLFSVFDAIGSIIGFVVRSFKELFNTFNNSFDGVNNQDGFFGSLLHILVQLSIKVQEVTGKISEFFDNIHLSSYTMERFARIAEGIKAAFDIVTEIVKAFFSSFSGNGTTALQNTISIFHSLLDILASIGDWLVELRDGLSEGGGFATIGKILAAPLKTLPSLFSNITGAFELFGNAITQVLDFIWGIISSFAEKSTDVLNGIAENLNIGDIFRIGLETGIAFKIFDWLDNLGDAISSLNIFTEFAGVIQSLGEILGALDRQINAEMLKTTAEAVLMLSAAVWILSSIDQDKLGGVLATITSLAFILVASLMFMSNALNTMALTNLMFAGGILRNFGLALLLLAAALKIVSTIPIKTLAVDTMILGTALGIMVGALYALSTAGSKLAPVGASLLLTAFSLLVVSGALKVMETIDADKLGQSFQYLAYTLLMMTLALGALSTMGAFVLSSGAGLAVLSFGLLMVSAALKVMESIDADKLGQSFQYLGYTLLMMTFALAALSTMGPMTLAASGALTMLSFALLILVSALKLMSSIEADVLSKSIESLGYALLMMVLSLAALSTMGPMVLVAAASLIVLSVAITLLVPALAALSAIDPEKLASAILILGAGLIVLGAVAAVIGGMAPLVIFGSVALTAFGVACLVVGAGLMVLVGGLSAVVGFIENLISKFSSVNDEIENTDSSLSNMFKDNPEIFEAAREMFKSFIDSIDLGGLVQKGVEAIGKFIEGVRSNMGNIVDQAFETIITFINSLAEAIETHGVELYDSIKNLATTIIETFKETIGEDIGQLIDKGKEAIQGFIDGIGEKIEDVKTKADEIIHALLGPFADLYDSLFGIGDRGTQGLIEGLGNKLDQVEGIASKISATVASASSATLDEHSPSRVMQHIGEFAALGLIKGIDDKTRDAELAMASFTDAIIAQSENAKNVFGDMAQPMIKPVLDLGNVYNGANRISALLDNKYSMGMAASISTTFSGMSTLQRLQEIQNETISSNEKMANAIESLRSDVVDTLYSLDRETAVYVDGKKLASTIARPMNRELGVMSRRGLR